ncbi:MAG: hypothetical protein HY921_07970 [Elusimicrobia bacterium]|nr:hypothetical protein [Elusimicrobiota bacterium]
MTDRRSTYFTFQGLMMAVLLLIFLYQYRGTEGWIARFDFLTIVLGLSLVYLRIAPLHVLGRWWFQAGLFMGDAALASLTLHWTQPQSDLYLIYFLIIFGTALTRSFTQSLLIAAVTSILYLLSAWSPSRGFPHDTGFWLRFNFLWISSALLAILSRDTQQAQSDQERKYRDRLVQVERLATLGQVAGEVAHRIKGPLTTIMVNAEVLAQRYGHEENILKELGEIQEEVGHCKEILKHLLDLGRIEEIDFRRVDMREPLRLALRSIEARRLRAGVRKKVSGLDRPLMVIGDQSLLQEAFAAILQNAVEACSKGGHIRLSVQEAGPSLRWPSLASSSSHFRVTIEDDGKGIEAADLESVFQPFFTTKGVEGTGLGLSAALRILQKHHGSVEAYSNGPGHGTRFTLMIPEAERGDRPNSTRKA